MATEWFVNGATELQGGNWEGKLHSRWNGWMKIGAVAYIDMRRCDGG